MDQIGAFASIFFDDIACIVYHIGVVARATNHGVGTRCAVECVFCAVAGDDVGQAIAGAVDGGSARQGQVFQVGAQCVGHRTHDQICTLVDVLNNRVGDVVDHVGVVARATDQVVDAATAVQSVVACQALQGVVTSVPGQAVVELGAAQVFDADVVVPCGFSNVLCRACQRSGHALGGVFVADGVLPSTAVERVSTQAAFEHVVTAAALQQVVLRITHQHVVLFRSNQVLDVGEGVARGVGASVVDLVVSIQVNADTHDGVHVSDGIGACTPIENITTPTAFEGVVSIATAQNVVFLIAHQGVCVGTAREVLDVGEHIALGIPTVVIELVVGSQINGHAFRRTCVTGGVVACATVQVVGTATTFQGVVAQATAQHVGLGVAGQLVVIGAAHQVLDVDEHIALGISAFVDGTGHQ